MTFLLGLFIGATCIGVPVGILVGALCAAAGRSDRAVTIDLTGAKPIPFDRKRIGA